MCLDRLALIPMGTNIKFLDLAAHGTGPQRESRLRWMCWLLLAVVVPGGLTAAAAAAAVTSGKPEGPYLRA